MIKKYLIALLATVLLIPITTIASETNHIIEKDIINVENRGIIHHSKINSNNNHVTKTTGVEVIANLSGNLNELNGTIIIPSSYKYELSGSIVDYKDDLQHIFYKGEVINKEGYEFEAYGTKQKDKDNYDFTINITKYDDNDELIDGLTISLDGSTPSTHTTQLKQREEEAEIMNTLPHLTSGNLMLGITVCKHIIHI